LVPLESNVLFSNMGWVQFPVARSSQKTLVGIVFALAVEGVAPDQPVVGQEAFVTVGDPDPPCCENINDTLGLSINVKYQHTRKISYEIRQEDY
jgi:hypothetical protein